MPEYWAILKDDGSGERGQAWTLMPGYRFKTEFGARRAFDGMAVQWNERARRGDIHPTWAGKFGTVHRIVHVSDGQTLQTVDLGDGNYYRGTAE